MAKHAGRDIHCLSYVLEYAERVGDAVGDDGRAEAEGGGAREQQPRGGVFREQRERLVERVVSEEPRVVAGEGGGSVGERPLEEDRGAVGANLGVVRVIGGA